MSVRKIVLKNIAWNWAGMTCEAAAAFVVMPFLVHRLGDTGYGLWILIGSLSSYFGLLDLGVRASVGRYAAYHRAKEDRAAVNATVSTALAISAAVGLLVLSCTVGVVWIFFTAFDVPPDQVASVRLALILICANLALTFPLNTFDGTLWAAQRFDLLNAIDIPATGLRVILTFSAIERGYGLVGLALLTLLLTISTGLAKALLSFREDPGLRLSPALVSRGSARELFGYGLCNFMITTARMTRAQMSPFLIGSLMGLSLVTVYSIAKRMFDYAEKVVWTATGVVAPLSTALHAQERHGRQRAMFVEGGRYCMALGLFFLIAFAFLGRPVIHLWIGPRMSYAATLLIILMVGECLPMSQSITGNMMLGMGRLKVLAGLSIAEVAIELPLAAALAGRWGLVGVCFAFAAVGTIFRGIGVLAYGCQTTGVPLSQYLIRAILPPLLLAVLPAFALFGIVFWHPPDSWTRLVTDGALFTILYALSCIPLLDHERLASLLLLVRGRFSRRPMVGSEVD